MGSLARFKLGDIIAGTGVRAFVETGCARGDGLAVAAARPEFESLWSCDIEPLMAIAAIARFAGDPRVVVARMDSARFLRAVVPSDLPPALFWLDAHYPGAEADLRDYTDPRIPEAVRLPLAEELEILRARRRGQDVIIVDDLRIYETGDWEAGPLPEGYGTPRPGGADWIRALFAPTHHLATLTQETGYLLMKPKN